MPMYVGFYHETVVVMSKALNFVEKSLENFFAEKKLQVDEEYHQLIEAEHKKSVEPINMARELLGAFDDMRFRPLDEQTWDKFLSVLRSALEVFLRDTLNAKAKTGLSAFNSTIEEINRTLTLEGFNNRKADLFAGYFPLQRINPEGTRIEIFLSYTHENKNVAGKIAESLKNKVDIFLAHEDIEISEEWRKEILKHLKNDRFLIALLTKEYASSVWANQEAGFMMGKEGKVIPLIIDEVDVKMFGFLEALQGIPVKCAKIEDCIEKILSATIEEKK